MNELIFYVYNPIVSLLIGCAFLWAFLAFKDRHWERRRPLLWLGVGWIGSAVLGTMIPPIGVAVVLIVPIAVTMGTFAYGLILALDFVLHDADETCPVCGKRFGRSRGTFDDRYFKCSKCRKCFRQADINKIRDAEGSIRWRVEQSVLPGEDTPFCVPVGVIEGGREIGV